MPWLQEELPSTLAALAAGVVETGGDLRFLAELSGTSGTGATGAPLELFAFDLVVGRVWSRLHTTILPSQLAQEYLMPASGFGQFLEKCSPEPQLKHLLHKFLLSCSSCCSAKEHGADEV